MAGKREQARIVRNLLDEYGQTFAAELDIPLRRNTPSPLFRLLCASLLYSAPIRATAATAAARALADHGWTTPAKLARSTWKQRAAALSAAGYARYDERTATLLGETAATLLAEYGGDLRRLRDAAARDTGEERRRLKAFKGIGDVGVDIFFREVQLVWDELYPFADKVSLATAAALGLPDNAEALAHHVTRDDFPRLLAALMRVRLAKSTDDIKAAAANAK